MKMNIPPEQNDSQQNTTAGGLPEHVYLDPQSFAHHRAESGESGVAVESGPAAEHQDEPVTVDPDLHDLPLTLGNLPRFLLLIPIRLYQMTLSRTLPPDTCRFYPTCSHYGYQAIYKYGALKGGLMAAWRVLRCNPFNKGGFDPVP